MHAQLITALALAGSAFAGKLPNISTTSTMTLYASKHTESTSTAEHHSACTVCPKDYDRNWNSDRVLNDTRKHHSSFKLFAYPEEAGIQSEAGIPLHVVTHGDSRDNMWQLKLADPMKDDAKSQRDQPKWNLHDNSLQTDGSAPINKTLYFRLYDGKYPKDTENWTATVFHPIATTMKNKKTYKNERNAKLIADKGWSLVRDDENPFAYTLKGSKPEGHFFACVDPDAIKDAMSTLPPPSVFDDDEADPADMVDLVSTMISMVSKLEIVYSEQQPKQEFDTAGNGLVDPKGCRPITIKAEGWTHPKQT
ncbi:hypothetical protein MBLNU13_g10796t1 [Cladosporium sp. NU13]